MQAEIPGAGDLAKCLALEKHFTSGRPGAAEEGFFLPGSSIALYETLFESGYLRVVRQGDDLVAFVAVLPPCHPLLIRLMSDAARFVASADAGPLAPDNSAWIAKIATMPSFQRQGAATLLYKHVFKDFRNFNILTATAKSPLRNYASEGFHNAMTMTVCGEYYGMNAVTNEPTVNTVWLKPSVMEH